MGDVEWAAVPSQVGEADLLYTVVSRTKLTKERAREYVDYLNTHGILAKAELKDDLFMRRSYAVCDDRQHIITALMTMKDLPVIIRDVEGRKGYRCACGDEAKFYLGETSRRS